MSQKSVDLVRALMSAECACGGPKQAKMSHCRECYFALPQTQRRALYAKLGSGYAEAYDNSLLTLKAKGRIRAVVS